MSSVPLPTGIDFMYWAALVREQFAASIPQLMAPEAWKDWAQQVVCSSQMSGIDVPRPDNYSQPLDWAVDFWRAYERGT